MSVMRIMTVMSLMIVNDECDDVRSVASPGDRGRCHGAAGAIGPGVSVYTGAGDIGA